jgi:hypothetical protein
MKAMDNNINSGNSLSDMAYAGVSILSMLIGWISMLNAKEVLQLTATLVSIAAGAMVFYNNYKQSKKNK